MKKVLSMMMIGGFVFGFTACGGAEDAADHATDMAAETTETVEAVVEETADATTETVETVVEETVEAGTDAVEEAIEAGTDAVEEVATDAVEAMKAL